MKRAEQLLPALGSARMGPRSSSLGAACLGRFCGSAARRSRSGRLAAAAGRGGGRRGGCRQHTSA